MSLEELSPQRRQELIQAIDTMLWHILVEDATGEPYPVTIANDDGSPATEDDLDMLRLNITRQRMDPED